MLLRSLECLYNIALLDELNLNQRNLIFVNELKEVLFFYFYLFTANIKLDHFKALSILSSLNKGLDRHLDNHD